MIDFIPFEQKLVTWFLIWLGVTIWLFVALQFRKEKIVKETVYKEIKVPEIVKIEVPMRPKKVEVRRIK